MSTVRLDTDLNCVPVTAVDQTEDVASHSPKSSTQARRRPCGHVKLSRSLSKSDSDLLVSCEEDVTLSEKTKSLIKCTMERTHLDRLSSLTADWEEVSTLGWSGNKS